MGIWSADFLLYLIEFAGIQSILCKLCHYLGPFCVFQHMLHPDLPPADRVMEVIVLILMTRVLWVSHPLSATLCSSKGHVELLAIISCFSSVIRATELGGWCYLKLSLPRPALSPFMWYSHFQKQM